MLKIKEETNQRAMATFGHRLRSRQPRTDQWLRKHSKEPIVVYGKQISIASHIWFSSQPSHFKGFCHLKGQSF
jgi:hypothetical protein